MKTMNETQKCELFYVLSHVTETISPYTKIVFDEVRNTYYVDCKMCFSKEQFEELVSLKKNIYL